MGAPHAFRVYLELMLLFGDPRERLMIAKVAVLFLLLIVSSSTAAIVSIKSIGATGGPLSDSPTPSLIRAVVLAALLTAVLSVGGDQSVRDLMIVAAVPFAGSMARMLLLVIRLRRRALGASRSTAVSA